MKWESRIILFVFILPLYLYKRAKLLQHGQWQLGAWIAAFLVYLVV